MVSLVPWGTDCDRPAAVCAGPLRPGAAALVAGGRPAAIRVDPAAPEAVRLAAAGLRGDLERLGGGASGPPTSAGAPAVVLAGVLGDGGPADALARSGRVDASRLRGRWEGYLQQVVEAPAPGVARAVVVLGADRRGAVYGLYDLSERAGVSPWAWWADVPTPHRPDLQVAPGARVDAPTVKYRGVFLNDEDPSLKSWAQGAFGGVNSRFYARVGELVLRLRGDLLWPAMWGKSLWEDDPRSPGVLEAEGVVVGTSHHEPMMRAHVDWARHGAGDWNYATNAARLRDFWREGVRRSAGEERLVTVGMRGDGDKPMVEGGAAVPLLQRIVADQRRIIAEETGRSPEATPQVWALYKEVQDYYDAGMRVPDDVTLLFSDDNWGNIRRLPEPGAKRAGGYGVYYHFDYVGGPRNYKWINTNQVERTWEQMRLAHARGADQLWIVNVGDLKPMELPTQFFLDYAWNPQAWPAAAMDGYTAAWAAQQFGPEHATEIGSILRRYTRWNARRKPELVGADSFSLLHYREAERVADRWDALADETRRVGAELPAADADAWRELVGYPVEASANLNRMYVLAALNQLHAAQGRASAGAEADEVARRFGRDAELSRAYEASAGGKWAGMMRQTHIGYTGWQEPKTDVMPAVVRPAIPARGALGAAVEGDARAWPAAGGAPPTVKLERGGVASRRLELFNRGRAPVRWTAVASAPWLQLSAHAGALGPDARLEVSVDWAHAPITPARAEVRVSGDDGTVLAFPVLADPVAPAGPPDAFLDGDGVVAVDATHFARAVGGWETIPNLGRTAAAVTGGPLDAAPAPGLRPDPAAPHLEYRVALRRAASARVRVDTAPSLDVRGKGGLRLAVSVDDGPAQLLNLEGDPSPKAWDAAVSDNHREVATAPFTLAAGPHVVKLWRVDPGVVVERVVVDAGGLRPSDLGPPESARLGALPPGPPLAEAQAAERWGAAAKAAASAPRSATGA